MENLYEKGESTSIIKDILAVIVPKIRTIMRSLYYEIPQLIKSILLGMVRQIRGK